MQKLKNFKQFLNEKMMDDVEDVQNVQIDDDIMEDEFVDTDNENLEDLEEEEITDILELSYDKDADEWNYQGELDLPESFEDFYEWFTDMDEENTLASMKEDDNEVVFYLPEDLYVEYLDNQSNIEPDENTFDEDEDESFDDDSNLNDWDDNDDYDEDSDI